MNPNALDASQVLEALDDLRRQVGQLTERVGALEQTLAEPTRRQEAGTEGISEEVVAAISAAIAAYLGKKPRIRQIRLAGGSSWAQQGRATIQASHTLSVRHR